MNQTATRNKTTRPAAGPSAGAAVREAEKHARPPDKRAQRKARTRREIYTAAMQLFSARGFDNVTIEEICEAAGCAKATFFLHFTGKAALIAEFNAHLVERLAAGLDPEAESAEARLRRLVRAIVAEYEANAPVMRQMAREFLNQPALVPAAEAANREVVHLVEQIIAEGQARGEFSRATDPALAATALVSTWGAFTARWSDVEPDIDVAAAHEALLDLVLGGLRPR